MNCECDICEVRRVIYAYAAARIAEIFDNTTLHGVAEQQENA